MRLGDEEAVHFAANELVGEERLKGVITGHRCLKQGA